jgi:hypothetical protein
MPFWDIASHNTMMTAYTAGCGGGLDAARHLLDGMLHIEIVCFQIIKYAATVNHHFLHLQIVSTSDYVSVNCFFKHKQINFPVQNIKATT